MVIHETSHNFLGSADHGYFTTECSETAPTSAQQAPQDLASGTAGDNPLFRFDNADSYACFVQFIVRSGAAALRRQATDYRAGNVRIEAEDTTTIFVQPPSGRRDPVFRLTGLPPNHGFRFSWRLLMAGREFRLQSDQSADTWTFNAATTRVSISAALELLLRSSGVSSATIVCDIALFEPAGHSRGVPRPYPNPFDAPVVRKTLEITLARSEDPWVGLRDPVDPADDLDLGP